MSRQSVFNKDNFWFKGNLHTHSTQSDGRLEVEEVARLYREQGWNFLAITDHDFFSNWQELNRDNFIIIPGIEVEANIPKFGRCHHIVGIHKDGDGARHLEKTERPSQMGMAGAQHLIDELAKDNYLSIYCHPSWSRVEWDDISELRRFTAIEIYNNGCAIEDHTGLCLWHWDAFLRRRIPIWGVATDDAHHWIEDRCGGWITVNAPSLTIKDVTDAIVAGRFYSSTGPEIIDYGLDGNRVYVECSPAQVIHIVTYEEKGRSYYPVTGDTISFAEHKLRGDEIFVRVEVVDSLGRTAWTNPIFFDW